MKTDRNHPILVADEVWVATALLHREYPEQEDFTPQQITKRAQKENIYGSLRPGVYQHAASHCVANRPPNPGRYIMLIESGKGRRRLYRPGDPFHPGRRGAKSLPARSNLPARYHELLAWYADEYVSGHKGAKKADPILALRGLGREVWASEAPDAYVARLRRDWR